MTLFLLSNTHALFIHSRLSEYQENEEETIAKQKQKQNKKIPPKTTSKKVT